MSREALFEMIVTQKEAQDLARKAAIKYLKPIDLTIAKGRNNIMVGPTVGQNERTSRLQSKGLPGWQTLWKGMNHFNTLLEGYINYSRRSINS